MTPFARRLRSGRLQVGLWQSLADPYTAELCAGAGYDWLLFDGEHAPNTLPRLLAQLQAVHGYDVEPIVRPPAAEPVIVKQLLDLGFRTLLLPMVDTAEHAAEMVAATRYPPHGVRGVASSTSRASRFGADRDYLAHAHEEISVILQIESAAALDNLHDILCVEGVDALFIGPGDLAASLGHLGNPSHPEVRAAISNAIEFIVDARRQVGIFASGPEDALGWAERGVSFAAIGSDMGVLSSGVQRLRAGVGDPAATAPR